MEDNKKLVDFVKILPDIQSFVEQLGLTRRFSYESSSESEDDSYDFEAHNELFQKVQRQLTEKEMSPLKELCELTGAKTVCLNFGNDEDEENDENEDGEDDEDGEDIEKELTEKEKKRLEKFIKKRNENPSYEAYLSRYGKLYKIQNKEAIYIFDSDIEVDLKTGNLIRVKRLDGIDGDEGVFYKTTTLIKNT
jgi:hypothetical protein